MVGCWRALSLGWLGLGWLAGCNWIYGLDATRLRDAGTTSDAPPPDVLPATCRVLLPSLVEQDTYLLDDKQHGVRSTSATGFDVNLVDAAHPGLFKFPIGGIAADEAIVAAVMTVVVVNRADECGITCGVCPSSDATRYRMFWNRGDWVDDAATATKRTTSGSWEQLFADGPSDRSALVVEATLPPGLGPRELVIPMTAGLATPPPPAWFADGFVTIQLRTDGTTPLAIAADDRDESTCADGAAKATVTLTVCTP